MFDNQPVALFTDLYEISMGQTYFSEGMGGQAVFETFSRKLPSSRRYILAAGLEDVLVYLENFRFRDEELEYLRGLNQFTEAFLDRLSLVRFTGDVWAVLEGSVVFPNEPLVQVVAPIIEAQLVETFVLNQIHFQSVIASKTARIVQAAEGRPVVEFGARRAHGLDAAMKGGRASYLAGAAGTSNLLAARRYGIPPFGTMAHSFVQAFDDELSAFEAFAKEHPGTTLLVDTYDTLRGVERVVDLARRLGTRFDVNGIRLDSGDLAMLSRGARERLDRGGLQRVKVFASSGLDETKIAALLASGSPIDAFGVGTSLSVSEDAPSLDMAYKLVEYGGKGRTKLSPGKPIYPFRKQIHRSFGRGVMSGDIVSRWDEAFPGEPMLVKVMEGGRRLDVPGMRLDDSRDRARAQLLTLPPGLRALESGASPYPVAFSPLVEREHQRLIESRR